MLLYSITYSTISYDEDVHGGDYDDDDNNVDDHNDIHMFIYFLFSSLFLPEVTCYNHQLLWMMLI